MPQTKAQQRAAQEVAAWLAAHEKNNSWLVAQTGVDPGTIGDFLNGKRWPKVGNQGKIEKALGWPAGAIRQMGYGGDPPTVGGANEDPDRVAAQQGALVEQDVSNAFVLAEVRAMRSDLEGVERRLDRRIDGLSERVARVESRPEPLGGPDGQT